MTRWPHRRTGPRGRILADRRQPTPDELAHRAEAIRADRAALLRRAVELGAVTPTEARYLELGATIARPLSLED